MARSRSRLSLSERREKASELFSKGFTVADVARRLDVTWDTAKGYQRWYENQLDEAVQERPGLLQDAIRNTVESLAEIDRVRAAAWQQYHTADSKSVKLQALSTIRNCQQDKAKILGIMGVQGELYNQFALVKTVQDRIIGFLRDELCREDREKLERFFASPDMRSYFSSGTELPALPLGEDEEDIAEAELV